MSQVLVLVSGGSWFRFQLLKSCTRTQSGSLDRTRTHEERISAHLDPVPPVRTRFGCGSRFGSDGPPDLLDLVPPARLVRQRAEGRRVRGGDPRL